MAEWARLLSECRGNLVAGSNPALPARKNTPEFSDVFFVLCWSRVSSEEMIFESHPTRNKKERGITRRASFSISHSI